MTAKQKMIFRLTSPINRFLFTLTVAIFVYLITGEFFQGVTRRLKGLLDKAHSR